MYFDPSIRKDETDQSRPCYQINLQSGVKNQFRDSSNFWFLFFWHFDPIKKPLGKIENDIKMSPVIQNCGRENSDKWIFIFYLKIKSIYLSGNGLIPTRFLEIISLAMVKFFNGVSLANFSFPLQFKCQFKFVLAKFIIIFFKRYLVGKFIFTFSGKFRLIFIWKLYIFFYFSRASFSDSFLLTF